MVRTDSFISVLEIGQTATNRDNDVGRHDGDVPCDPKSRRVHRQRVAGNYLKDSPGRCRRRTCLRPPLKDLNHGGKRSRFSLRRRWRAVRTWFLCRRGNGEKPTGNGRETRKCQWRFVAETPRREFASRRFLPLETAPLDRRRHAPTKLVLLVVLVGVFSVCGSAGR